MRLRRRDAVRMLVAAVGVLMMPSFAEEVWAGQNEGARAERDERRSWARAEQDEQRTWERVSTDERPFALRDPESGALYAQESAAPYRVHRGNDDGSAWAEVDLPPTPGSRPLLALDPRNGALHFATGAEGIYRNDGAAGWTLVLPTDEQVDSLMIGPGEPGAVLVRLARRQRVSTGGPSFRSSAEPRGGDILALATQL